MTKWLHLKLELLASFEEAIRRVGMSGPNNVLCMDSQISFGNVPQKGFLRETVQERGTAGMDR